MMETMTVEVKSFPNHPMQRLVTVALNHSTASERAQTRIEFQIFADHPKMLRCSKSNSTMPGADPNRMENLLMSYLGTDEETAARKFRLTPLDEATGEIDAEAMDFELWESAEEPHVPVKMLVPSMPATAPESSISNYKQGISESDIQTWLDDELHGTFEALDKPVDDIKCNDVISVAYDGFLIEELPKITNRYTEKPHDIKLYSALLEQFPSAYDKLMEIVPSSVKVYWGRFRSLEEKPTPFGSLGMTVVNESDVNQTLLNGRRLAVNDSPYTGVPKIPAGVIGKRALTLEEQGQLLQNAKSAAGRKLWGCWWCDDDDDDDDYVYVPPKNMPQIQAPTTSACDQYYSRTSPKITLDVDRNPTVMTFEGWSGRWPKVRHWATCLPF